MHRGLRTAMAAVALAGIAGACGDPVGPALAVRDTYDLVLAGGHPLPYVRYDRLNEYRVTSATLTLRTTTWLHVVNGVEISGEYRVRGDTVALTREGQPWGAYLHEGAALVPLPGTGATWVKQGKIETTPCRYDTYRMTRRQPPADSMPMLASHLWLWEDGRFDVQSYVAGIVWRQTGSYAAEADGTLHFDPAIEMWSEAEGVREGEEVRIGAVTYARE
jgi:hypothetical protein